MIILLYICFYLVKVSWVCQKLTRIVLERWERSRTGLEHRERSQWEDGDLAYILEDRQQDLLILTSSQILPQQEVIQFENLVC